VADFGPVLALAETSVKSDPKSLQLAEGVGAVLYRAGRMEEAVQKLTEADLLTANHSGTETSPAYCWFLLAMVHQRLQHFAEAKQWYGKACEEMGRVFYVHEAGIATLTWNRRATLKLLRREAAALLGIDDPAVPRVAEGAPLKQSDATINTDESSYWTWRTKADRHIRAFRWSEAKADAVRAAAMHAQDEPTDDHSYRELCRRLLAQYAETRDPMWAERTAKACLMLPLDGESLAAASRLTEKALTLDEKHWVIPFSQVAAAMAAYRRGDFGGSIDWSNKALARESDNVWFRNAEAHFVRALALGRLDRVAEAKAAYQKADEILKNAQAAARAREVVDPAWQDFAICEVWRQEAATLLKIPATLPEDAAPASTVNSTADKK
jgi:tetratricopeptide (TPR) repeat protein